MYLIPNEGDVVIEELPLSHSLPISKIYFSTFLCAHPDSVLESLGLTSVAPA